MARLSPEKSCENKPFFLLLVNKHVVICIESQTLFCFEGEAEVAHYAISSAKAGLGSEAGSYKTPTGHFQIGQKIGADCPLGTLFVSRVPQGIFTPLPPQEEKINPSEDKILTRILWLEGLEEANRNTKERFIYIHGTNHETLIGTPASHGCIRMKNLDICSFFDWAEEQMPLVIA